MHPKDIHHPPLFALWAAVLLLPGLYGAIGLGNRVYVAIFGVQIAGWLFYAVSEAWRRRKASR